jgi:competence ComEA-like helix-hairpin-helix protein
MASVLLLGILHFHATAQFERHTVGAVPAALGGSGVMLIGDLWGGYLNPALYAGFSEFTASVSHVPYRFGLSELQTSAVSAIVPLRRMNPAITITRYGFDMYNETTVTAAGGREIGDRVRFGAALNWYHLSIERYGSTAAVGIDAGFHASLNDHLEMGIAVTNINRPVIGAGRNAIPQTFTAGFAYSPHPLFSVVGEVHKDIAFEPEFRVGTEFYISGNVLLRGGMNERPSLITGGCSFIVGNVQIDYALQWHLVLGQTHYLSASFRLPRQPTRSAQNPGIVRGTINHMPSIPVPDVVAGRTVRAYIQHPDVHSLLRFLNTADPAALKELPGIGEVTARRIIQFRDESGGFREIRQLRSVQGIGERTLERILDYWKRRGYADE